MTFRIRMLITAVGVCHLLAFSRLVTSQLLPASNAPAQEVTISANTQEKAGDTYTLRGNAEISYRGYMLRADEISYNQITGDVRARGHVVFDGGPHDEHVEASHGTYNIQTQNGRFYEVVGTTGARFRGKHVVLTSSSPFAFSGRIVEKFGRDRIVVHHGMVTSCRLDSRKWSFNAATIIVDIGENAKIYSSNFRLAHVPVFYFPFVRLPVEKLGRQTGLLMPTIGRSSSKGTTLGEAVYWAINRSMDTTLGAEYYSRRGWAQHGEFRARPSDSSYMDFRYFGVVDRGLEPQHEDQGGQEASLNAEGMLPLGIRAVSNVNYLSSFVFRLAFSETFTQAVNSEVKSVAFLSKAENGYFFNVMGSRYQNFQSTQRGDQITILRLPSFDFSSVEKQLGATPIHWSYDGAVQGVSRREPDFVTNDLVGRFDVVPRVSVPLHWHGWDFRPEFALQETRYTQDKIPTVGVGIPGNQPVTRQAFDGSVELRPPPLSKVFDKTLLSRKIKHTIEPRAVYRRVIGVDNFSQIIRFDARDILSNTNEIEYALVNRIYTKRAELPDCETRTAVAEKPAKSPQGSDKSEKTEKTQPTLPARQDCAAPAREVFSWELGQKYFMDRTFGGALVSGQRNVFTTTAELTGIAFLTEPRSFSPLVSRMRIRVRNAMDVEWHFDYDTKKGRINASTAILNQRFGDFFVGGSHAFLEAPGEVFVSSPVPAAPSQFNQFRWLVGYGSPTKRGISAAANIGYDIFSHFLQYSAFQSSYNWDCCGISVEYRRLALGSVRNENQFRFALSLTNIGTFGTMRKQERLF